MSDPSGTDAQASVRTDEPANAARSGGTALKLRDEVRMTGRAWLFVAPVLIALAVVIGYPVLRALWMSFH